MQMFSISLRNLCVLCVSAVILPNQFLTADTQRTQRLRREEIHIRALSGRSAN